MTTPRRIARTLGRALRTAADAYAESAWVYRYGPGFAPTAPLHFADSARGAAAPAAPPLGAARPAAHAPARRSPAHASASA